MPVGIDSTFLETDSPQSNTHTHTPWFGVWEIKAGHQLLLCGLITWPPLDKDFPGYRGNILKHLHLLCTQQQTDKGTQLLTQWDDTELTQVDSTDTDKHKNKKPPVLLPPQHCPSWSSMSDRTQAWSGATEHRRYYRGAWGTLKPFPN